MGEIIISFIGLSIATISILIVFWDHFKDDRLLTKRVHYFYENIEGLTFSFYQIEKSKFSFIESKGIKEYEDVFFKFEKRNIFFRGIIEQSFEYLSKYLGLAYFSKPNYYISNNHDYYIEHTGTVYNFYCELNKTRLGKRNSFKNNELNKYIIDESAIEIINNFLEKLRDHWNKYYSKKLFRKKLKPKLDFSELLNKT
jgi:hypothetical protein